MLCLFSILFLWPTRPLLSSRPFHLEGCSSSSVPFFSRTVPLHLSPLPAARQNGAIDLQGDQNYVSTHVYLVHMYT